MTQHQDYSFDSSTTLTLAYVVTPTHASCDDMLLLFMGIGYIPQFSAWHGHDDMQAKQGSVKHLHCSCSLGLTNGALAGSWAAHQPAQQKV